jgi:hypothetical protein
LPEAAADRGRHSAYCGGRKRAARGSGLGAAAVWPFGVWRGSWRPQAAQAPSASQHYDVETRRWRPPRLGATKSARRGAGALAAGAGAGAAAGCAPPVNGVGSAVAFCQSLSRRTKSPAASSQAFRPLISPLSFPSPSHLPSPVWLPPNRCLILPAVAAPAAASPPRQTPNKEPFFCISFHLVPVCMILPERRRMTNVEMMD